MPQTGSDLVGAGYPTGWPMYAALGGLTNVSSPNQPCRTNLEWFGFNTAVATTNVLLGGSTGAGAVAAVPVTPGEVITKVGVLVTNTAGGTPTHGFAAVYAGTGSAPALIAQSPDTGSGAIAANGLYNWTFTSPLSVSAINAPFGFVYVLMSVTAGTLPTIVTVTGPTIGAWGTMVPPSTAPLLFAATQGSGLGATAPATIASYTNVATVPAVFLT